MQRAISATAGFHTVPAARQAEKPPTEEELAAAAGQFARTDDSIVVKHPPEAQLPTEETVVGTDRAGAHVFPTLATFSLQGKVGVVTGGARGLGLVMGQGMVTSGSDLAIVDLNKEEATRQAQSIIETFKADHPDKKPPKVTAHYADVSDPVSVEACIAEIVAEHGRIDNLVTSAGFTENFEAVAYPIERMRKLWGVNVDGTYLFATSVARHLMGRNAKGSMVFIGSMSGAIVNVPQPQAYVTSHISLYTPLPNRDDHPSSITQGIKLTTAITTAPTTPPRPPSATCAPRSASSGPGPASASTASRRATCSQPSRKRSSTTNPTSSGSGPPSSRRAAWARPRT
jgi:NADP-dependent 3-hydroxy acid dehydrogenase YdfG